MLSENEFIKQIKEHEKIIWKVISMYLDNPGDREDLRQEILLNAWKGSRNFKGDAKFSTWLYRVALNTAITFYRKDRKHNELLVRDEHAIEGSQMPEEVDENVEAMNAAIRRLSDIDKAIVMLYLDEYSYAEISVIMGITVNNLAVKMNRIKTRLRENTVNSQSD